MCAEMDSLFYYIELDSLVTGKQIALHKMQCMKLMGMALGLRVSNAISYCLSEGVFKEAVFKAYNDKYKEAF